MRINKELRVIELFAGVGSQTQALKNIGVPHKVVAVSDNDKYADRSYRALHGGGVLNLGDIREIQELPEADLWTYSFPCTDVSIAGKHAGLYGTRSGLLWEVERLLLKAKERERLPRYLLLENVKNLVGKAFRADYDKWLAFLLSIGYKNFWQVLNAREYGNIPQNRERVFCVSILDKNAEYAFPPKVPLTVKLKDLLETEAEPKYYIKYSEAAGMLKTRYHHNRERVQTKDWCRALVARDFHSPACVPAGGMDRALWDFARRLTVRVPVPDRNAPFIVAQRGRNPDNPSCRTVGIPTLQRFEPNFKGVCNALTSVGKDNLVCELAGDCDVYSLDDLYNGLKIRKLTEREYWRLMGWRDWQIDKVIAAGVSARQMVRQAGNGIVVPVLEAVFGGLFL